MARFFGQGSLLVPSRLFDANGRLVGLENANIMTPANLPHTGDCLTPHGFEGGWPAMFSSILDRFTNRPQRRARACAQTKTSSGGVPGPGSR